MKTKSKTHGIHKSCKAKTSLGRKCSRLVGKDCKKEGMCTQHHKMSKKVTKSPVKSKVDTYYTLEDGGNPFKVEIKKIDKSSLYEVSVYKNKLSEEDGYNSYEKSPLATYKVEKVFIGKDPETNSLDGNSILLELDSKKLKYVFIGATVYSFTAYSKIIDYVSPAENSAYPFAIDENGNCYLNGLDFGSVVLTINEEIKKLLQNKSNPYPYEYYYQNNRILNVYIGNEEKYLEYTGEDFDTFKKYITQNIPNGTELDMYFMNKDGEKELLKKEKYKSFMEKIAEKKGFKPFLEKYILCKSFNDTFC